MKNFLAIFLVIMPLSIFAQDYTTTKPKDCKFCVHDIQQTVRAALLKADAKIQFLIRNGELSAVARRYFQSYLEKIGSYNETDPTIKNIEEAYKTELVNAFVVKEFKETYPDLIYDRSKWMFNNVGGIYANMIILYLSLDEYLVLWGTTLPAENKFSGYYDFMNEFDVMVTGEMLSHDLDAPGHMAVSYQPFFQDHKLSDTVDTSNLEPGNVRAYSLSAYTYMISYARGDMLKVFLPGAIMPGIFVNQDWKSLWLHIKESVKAFRHSRKQNRENINDEYFKANPSYRAISIIDEVIR